MPDNAPLSTQTEKDQKDLEQRRHDYATGYARHMEESMIYTTTDSRMALGMRMAKHVFPDPTQHPEIEIGDCMYRFANNRFDRKITYCDGIQEWVVCHWYTPDSVKKLNELLDVSHG